MFDVFGDINYLAALIAYAVLSGLGYVWFELVVARQYVVALGREHEPAHEPDAAFFVGQLLPGALVVLTSAVLVEALDITGTGDALVFGLVVGVGYLSAMTLQIANNPNFPHTFRYTAVNVPYFVVGSLLTSVILVLLR